MGRVMRTFGRLAVALVCVAGALVAPAARADIPPLDSCDVEGSSCQNVGGDAGQPGVCSARTCRRETGLGGADGVMFYDCLLCEKATVPGADGTGGASAGAAAVAGEGGASIATGGANVALAGNAGEVANGAAGAATGAGGNPAVPGGDAGEDGCSCTFRSLGSERGVAALLLGLGLTALRSSRRRR